MKVVIITGSELRHDFVRQAIASSKNIDVLRSYCEKNAIVDRLTPTACGKEKDIRLDHLRSREVSESDFFSAFLNLSNDLSRPVYIERGDINSEKCFNQISSIKPDLLVAFGCSIVKPPLLNEYRGRFLNVHLGLSPYYRGSGTNFWPLVNNEPQYVGVTFMHIDEGVDTGEVIHQIRPRLYPNDSPHQIGNRLISDMALVYRSVIENFHQLEPARQLARLENEKYYRDRDFSVESVLQLYSNFENGMIGDYLAKKSKVDCDVPIVTNGKIVIDTQRFGITPAG